MSFFTDLRVLYHLTLTPIRGRTHAERLEGFYRGQAADYDSFRQRLLQGRKELLAALPTAEGGVWVDMGGGTGANLESYGDRIRQLSKVYVVDLAPSLLEIARKRAETYGWSNVEAVAADATTFKPRGEPADLVTFSYSLTMIPDWFAAIDQAWQLLRPGGTIGVVDFYVSRKHPDEGRMRHGWFTRSFWPIWFNGDNVYPSPDHVPYLHRRFRVEHFSEHRARMPYMPGFRAPYYLFIGRKNAAPAA